jgi:predicted nucleic acid-binding protein
MKIFVWDTSALINIKEGNSDGYSPARSLFKDLSDGWIKGPYRNIFPAIAFFEINATVSQKHRTGSNILRDFYILRSQKETYPVDNKLIRKCAQLVETEGFSSLRGADLIFACIAKIEGGYLVTLDKAFNKLRDKISVIDLNESRDQAVYRSQIDG